MNAARWSWRIVLLALLCPWIRTYGWVSSYIEEIDSAYEFSGLFKPEMFYGKNISLLNDLNYFDRILFWRHIIDLNLDIRYGKKTFGRDVLHFYGTMRDRGIWGNPKSIASTTSSPVKLSETVFGLHDHAIPRHIFWIRELWLEMDIAELLRLNLKSRHTFTLGAFKFELGRGITLGSAYAAGPELIGFYSEDIIDQYAFGGKFSGFFAEPTVTYDLYAAILQNKSSSTSDTGEHIYGQAYGHLRSPERGFGSVSFLVAGRTQWTPFNDKKTCGKLTLEPYWVYLNDPEQRLEFIGGARVLMGSLGFAAEYEGPKFACGFDCAANMGDQDVIGWDRNRIAIKAIDASLYETNTQVVYKNPDNPDDPQNGKVIPYVLGKSQAIIDKATRSESENGDQIGVYEGDLGYLQGPIYMANSKHRFRDPYTNKYNGWMFVADAALKTADDKLQCAATVGFASGDQNPHYGNKDGVYSGFVGIQEYYYGKRVKSAFVLGSAGRIKRPLSLPVSDSYFRHAPWVNRFTNLRYWGVGLTKKKDWEKGRSFMFNPNMLFFWQDEPTKGFAADVINDLAMHRRRLHGHDTSWDASSFLGTELNVFMDYFAFKNLKLFCVASLFIPGDFFMDIRGRPISEEQMRALDKVDVSGFVAEKLPNIGADVGVTFNFGLEYTF